jgi:hypothetical protein
MPIITLTTDFGARDYYVGAMKGVILSNVPDANIVDITHDVPPQSVIGGALIVSELPSCFPPETIHVAVVDPGVGGDRAILAARYADQTFLAPDNGILSRVDRLCDRQALYRVENRTWYRKTVSSTFHGRDIFAPVAARLAAGAPLSDVGPLAGEMDRSGWIEPKPIDGIGIEGRVIHIDAFGNLITNVDQEAVTDSVLTDSITVLLGRREVGPLRAYYGEVGAGLPIALTGSSGLIEISVNRGRASDYFGGKIGDPVFLRTTRTHG